VIYLTSGSNNETWPPSNQTTPNLQGSSTGSSSSSSSASNSSSGSSSNPPSGSIVVGGYQATTDFTNPLYQAALVDLYVEYPFLKNFTLYHVEDQIVNG
jgi:hypothetical protein